MTDHVHDGSGIDCPECGTAITTPGPYTADGMEDTRTATDAYYARLAAERRAAR